MIRDGDRVLLSKPTNWQAIDGEYECRGLATTRPASFGDGPRFGTSGCTHCICIRKHPIGNQQWITHDLSSLRLDTTLVKQYAAEFCGTKDLRQASREHVASLYIKHIAEFAARDREKLLVKLDSFARQAGAA